MLIKNAIGGIALIASTAIGAAILALPVSTAHLGFTQTIACFFISWIFMTLGALYILETNLTVGYGSNLISMAEKTLSTPGKWVTWVIYLALLYALTAAHLAGASIWLREGLGHFQLPLSPFYGAILTALILIGLMLLGTHAIDWINRFLIIGLISIFATLIFSSLAHVKSALLFSQPTVMDLRPFPLIVTAFGSAIVIPSLTEYLKGNGRQLVKVVLIGSLIPFTVYLIWELAILGIIPLQGQSGLLTIQQNGHPVTDVPLALQTLLHNNWITKAASYFSIFALIASFLGLCLSLFDFLADGLKIQKDLKGKLFLALIAFLPPLLFIAYYPYGFSLILSLAGLFVALLLGILPVLMVWQARYHLKLAQPLQILGGKTLLSLTFIFFLIIIGIECFNQWEAFHAHLNRN